MHKPRNGHLLRGVAGLGVAASLLLAGPSPARAGVGVWTMEGELGSGPIAVAIDPALSATLYAVTEDRGGLFKSTDGGAHWAAINTGLPDLASLTVTTPAIDPLVSATLYVATGGAGVFKSIDGGAHWTARNTDLTDLYVYGVAIDPLVPNTLYATTSTGMFKSTDGGEHWADLHAIVLPSIVAIDPLVPTTLYASTTDALDLGTPLFKSTDGGMNWADASNGLPVFHNVIALAIDPVVSTTLYAGTDLNFASGGLFKTTSGGAHWEQLFLSAAVVTLAIDPVVSATLYAGTNGAGVFKSIDGGAHWTAVNTGLTDLYVYSLAIDPRRSTLYAGTQHGLFDFEMVTTTTTTTLPCTTARCQLDAALRTPMCADQTVPSSVTGKFDRAVGLIDRASMTSGKRARRLLKRTKKILRNAGATATRAAKGKRRNISADCAAVLKATSEDVAGGLGE